MTNDFDHAAKSRPRNAGLETAKAQLVITDVAQFRHLLKQLAKAIIKLETTFEGDSNDDEHDAAYELSKVGQEFLQAFWPQRYEAMQKLIAAIHDDGDEHGIQ